MKKDQVEIGVTYVAKVSNKLVHVRLDKENPRGGWDGTNIATSRPVRIKSAQRLRGPAPKTKAGKEEPQVEQQLEANEPETETHADGEQEAVTAEATEGDSAAEDSEPAPEASVEAPAKKQRAKRTKKPVGEKGPKAMSCLDAAEVVLKSRGEPMACKAMIEGMVEKGLWTTNAPTPAATLYSAILREITKKGNKSRFKKTDRGLFALTA